MNNKPKNLLSNLAGLFFLSGFSALIYQVSWQRLLFIGFGVDLTSITLIISVFMMGLGIGAFFGGRIADKYPNKVVLIFCIVELLIGLFGLSSQYFIKTLQQMMVGSSLYYSALAIFLLLLFPTFLMGLTLPLLTRHFDKSINSIGQSIGLLYFYNTLGAAMGALATGFIFFNYLGLFYTILLAATINILVALLILIVRGKSDAL